MQLKKFNKVSGLLSVAACSLIGANAHTEDASQQSSPSNSDAWRFDTAVMIYSEPDRVDALEGIISGTKDFGDERIFSGKLVIDSLTGASATGAMPQQSPETYTRPSGNGQYEVAAGDTPLDDTFRDTRLQVNGQWTQPLGEDYRVSGGLHFSNEYDYLSIALNGSIAKNLNNNNTTLSLGLSHSFDSIDPEGGRPIAFAEMPDSKEQFATEEEFRTAFDATRQQGGDDTKNTTDLVLGLTQVINRKWLVQFNLGLSSVDGYLTDPFKVISQVDSDGVIQSNIYENRPDSRSKTFLYAQSKYYIKGSVLDTSYRFTNDDWGLSSHTIDMRYRIPVGDQSYLQPHLRYYSQSAVDFYQRYLVAGEALPEHVSADYRIGDLTAYTFGLKYGLNLKNDREFSARIEYYQQQASGDAAVGMSELEGLDLYPSVDALVVQFGYSF